MAQNEGWKLPEEVPFKKRLLYWASIYFGLQLPLILLFPFILNYPWGLAPYLALIFGQPKSSPPVAYYTMGYLFYAVHFVLTLILANKKAFRVLIIILIVVASLNTVSCMKTTAPLWYKGIGKIQG